MPNKTVVNKNDSHLDQLNLLTKVLPKGTIEPPWLLKTWERGLPLNILHPALESVHALLRRHGITDFTNLPDCLRFLPRHSYKVRSSSGEFKKVGPIPAIIAAVLTRRGMLAGLHQFFLTPGHPPQTIEVFKGATVGKIIELRPPQDGKTILCDKLLIGLKYLQEGKTGVQVTVHKNTQ